VIVSHEHRFVFLKTRKTAGTSIEVALSKIAGSDAIVTPLHPPESGHEPRNHEEEVKNDGSHAVPWKKMLRDLSATYDPSRYEAYLPYIPYFSHMPAWMARIKLGPDVWDGYFKFAVERNPWEKVASLYWWTHRDRNRPPDFEEWLRNDESVVSDRRIYTLNGDFAVDLLGRYETLDADVRRFLDRLGVGVEELKLPRTKSGARRNGGLYSPGGADHVGRVFRREIELFGYECPPGLML
jgi:hypothetical protein